MADEKVVAEATPAPGTPEEAAPGLNFSDVWQFLPLVMAFIQAVRAGLAEIPVIRLRALGKRLRIGPIPIVVEQ